MENKVKPRYDNAGSEFGLVHRELPPSHTMFDIDHMEVTATVKMIASKEDYTFIEYRMDWNNSDVNFVAMFEIKHKSSDIVKKQITEQKEGTAIFAQKKMCEKLSMRYFYVVANNGNKPFNFIEIDNSIKGYTYKGSLDYTEFNKKENINKFWKEVLNII